MFVLCVLYSKVKKAQPGQSSSTVEVQKKSCQWNGCLSVVSVLCLSRRGLCDGLITRPEESTECGTSLCVISEPPE
jgi:hypothetical protein